MNEEVLLLSPPEPGRYLLYWKGETQLMRERTRATTLNPGNIENILGQMIKALNDAEIPQIGRNGIIFIIQDEN